MFDHCLVPLTCMFPIYHTTCRTNNMPFLSSTRVITFPLPPFLVRLVSDTTYDTAPFHTSHIFLPYLYRLSHIPSPCPILTHSLSHPPFSVSIRTGPHTYISFYLQTPLPWHDINFPNLHTRNPRSPYLPPNRPIISRASFLNHHPLPIYTLPFRTSH